MNLKVNGQTARWESVFLLNDGTLAVAGVGVSQQTFLATTIVWHFSADGKLNTAFGAGGQVSLSLPDIGWPSLTIQGDGKILASGQDQNTYNGTVISRFNADGSPDKTFNGSGSVVIPLTGDPLDYGGVWVQSDGELLVTQGGDGVFEVMRLSANGTIDTKFGTDGEVTVSLDPQITPAPEASLLPDGKVLLEGTTSPMGDLDLGQETFGLVRLTATGALDPSFGTAGRFDTVFPSQGPGQSPPGVSPSDLVFQPDGKAVVVGSALDSSGTFIAMARYQLNDSAPVPAASKTTLSAPAAAPYGQAVTLTATVTGTGKPTGTVTFLDGTTVLGSATVGGNGKALFTATHLAPRASTHGAVLRRRRRSRQRFRRRRRRRGQGVHAPHGHGRTDECSARTNRHPYGAGRLVAPGRPAEFRDGHVHGGDQETGRGRGDEGERRGESHRPVGGQAHDCRLLQWRCEPHGLFLDIHVYRQVVQMTFLFTRSVCRRDAPALRSEDSASRLHGSERPPSADTPS